MFNAVKATEWDLVVEALVSNEQVRRSVSRHLLEIQKHNYHYYLSGLHLISLSARHSYEPTITINICTTARTILRLEPDR